MNSSRRLKAGASLATARLQGELMSEILGKRARLKGPCFGVNGEPIAPPTGTIMIVDINDRLSLRGGMLGPGKGITVDIDGDDGRLYMRIPADAVELI